MSTERIEPGKARQQHAVDAESAAKAIESLAESEERFRTAVAVTSDILWTNDASGQMRGEQPGWGAFTGQTIDEYQGYGWSRAVHPEDVQPTIDAWERAVAERKMFIFEHRVRRRDGVYRLFSIRAVPILRADGEVREWVGIHADVTDQKREEEERRQLLESERAARSEAERSSRMKDEFLATLSHELRTPLNAIVGWAQLLRRGTMNAEDIREGLEVIERNARVQTQLIEDLLDMSRIISGKVRLDVRQVELPGFIEAAIKTVQPTADAKGVRLEKILDSRAGFVSGDPNRLQQVAWNLLSNAIKFTEKGGKIQVLLERVNSHIEISVCDTGRGISEEFLPHVFERFRQADASTTRRHGGLGLGLAIVKQLVELHGGTIGVKSPGEGRGTTFTVNLPLAVIHRNGGDAQRSHPKLPTDHSGAFESVDLCGVKVVVVDDEADALGLIARILQECGAEVFAVSSALDALGVIGRELPHVLISDIGMPDVDGYELLRRIRLAGRDKGGGVPAIALTAFARTQDRIRALHAGFAVHVSKPVEPAELIAAVASLAGRAWLG